MAAARDDASLGVEAAVAKPIKVGDADTVKIVARQLIENVDGQLEKIRKSMARGDRERIRREAHAIKGGAATMEAVALSQAAARLEKINELCPPENSPA